VVTVDDRQVSVEHDDVIRGLRGGLECRTAVADSVDGHSRLAHSLRDPVRKSRVILDHQHPHESKYAHVSMTSVRHFA
jgi:hypothetical protein